MDPFDLIETGKIKRYFSAKQKLNTPNLVSHITQRAAGRGSLFLEGEDYLTMLGLLKGIAEKRSIRLYAFCLMPNHIHLLLSPREENLQDAMRDIFSRYASRFNRKYERKGHLFGGPYRQAVCLDDSYLLAASLYIHLNPVRGELVKDSLSYPWSSCRLYCDIDAPKSFIDPTFVLNLISEDDLWRKAEYLRILKQWHGQKTMDILEQEDAIERFRSKLASLFPGLFGPGKRENIIPGLSGARLIDIAKLEEMIERSRNPSSPNRPESRAARKFLTEQLIARGFKKSEVAKRLGISPKTVYNLLKIP